MGRFGPPPTRSARCRARRLDHGTRLTLRGGIGISRKHGLSCDNLVSADVVTSTAGS
jgi:hypothetical protein